MNERMRKWGASGSVIRKIAEYGKMRKAEIGEENVFDFSIGNPSVPAPEKIKNDLIELLRTQPPQNLHGYTAAQGDPGVRKAIADYLNETYGAGLSWDLIYLTAGSSASLTVSLTAILNPGDEVILLAPYFTEYTVFIERAGGIPVPVMCNTETFQPDFDALESAIGKKTRAMIVNFPNNPTGAVLTEENANRLAELLKRKSAELGSEIYLISDEPYRELVYEDIRVPYLTRYYDRTLVCYSISKSLSLPGERFGYLAVSPKMPEAKDLFDAVCGAGRALGFICAPSLFQYLIPKCLGKTSDFTVYKTNRDLLWKSLTKFGFTGCAPKGAFYFFMKSPEPDAKAFCERAKKRELLFVPSDDFGCPGYVRISYCVSTEQVKRSLPAFEALAKEYGLTSES